MAESSIFHNVVVDNCEKCERLLSAIEKSKNINIPIGDSITVEKVSGKEVQRLFSKCVE